MSKKIKTNNNRDYLVLAVSLVVLLALPYVLNMSGAKPGF